jgi:membrane dipeptidase
MFIVDAHLDLAYAALNFDRDLRQPLDVVRRREPADPGQRGIATVTFPALQEAGVGLIFGTLFVLPANNPIAALTETAAYNTPDEAHQQAMAQLDYYHRLADADDSLRLVGDLASLAEVVASHQAEGEEKRPLLGIVPLMEGADPIRRPEEAELWYERGLRLVGLAWDDTRYAAGAWRGNGGLTGEGQQLLETLADWGFIVDLTHLSEKASHEVMDRYEGTIVATHNNARALVSGERHFSDEQIRRLGEERDGMIGVVLYNRFLREGYSKGDPKEQVTLDHVVDHIDHICQLLGNADHVGIGSDFDGGFGAADIPAELDSVTDLPLLATRLQDRGYTAEQINGIMGGNWLTLLRHTWAA